jgi:beta-glucosidase
MAAFYYVGRDTHQVPVNFNSWTRDKFGFQHPVAQKGYGQVNWGVDVRGDHGKLIREHAAKSTVLLKNTAKALPLTGQEKMMAVFGDDAGDNPLGPNGCSDHGCDSGTLAMGWGSGTASYSSLISPLTALQNEVAANNGRIEWVTDGWALAQAKAVASQATVSLVFVNADSGEGYISYDNNIGDRQNLTLWKNGEAVIEAVTSVCNNTIVVMHTVGPVLIDSWVNNPNVSSALPAWLVWFTLFNISTGHSHSVGWSAWGTKRKRHC